MFYHWLRPFSILLWSLRVGVKLTNTKDQVLENVSTVIPVFTYFLCIDRPQHFLSYMNCLRLKEYCTAVHNLYHYFDRKACPPNDGTQGKKKGDDVAMRYAALNLASLQFRFGNKEECKAALKVTFFL